jgi:hypothetical protein
MEVRPMSTEPRSPSEHYQAAERLLAATAENPANAPTLAICHALLCAAPRRARKRPELPAQHGGSPQARWLYGDDESEQDQS